MIHRWVIVFLMVLGMGILPLSLSGQELPVVHYGVAEGLISVVINALEQGPDGRIWIAHHAGLSAYDGAQFRHWTKRDGLLESSPSGIRMDGSGALWILFPDSGIQVLSPEGYIHTVPDPGGILPRDRLTFLFLTAKGEVVAGGRHGLYRLGFEGVESPSSLDPDGALDIRSFLDLGGDEGFLAGTSDGVFLLRGEESRRLDLPYERMATRSIADIIHDPAGNLWVLSVEGDLVHLKNGEPRVWRLEKSGAGSAQSFYVLRRDSRGDIWISSTQGLYRWRAGRIDRFSVDDGLSGDWINALLVDRQGVLWLGSESGLDKISHPAFRNYRSRRGFPVNSVWAISQLPNGSVWVGTNSGIVEIKHDGEWRLIGKAQGLEDVTIVDLSILPDGRAWILGYNHLQFWDGRGFRYFPYAPFARISLNGLLPRPDRRVWIATSEGVFEFNAASETFRPAALNELLGSDKSLIALFQHGNGDVYLLGRTLRILKPDGRLEDLSLPDWGSGISVFKMLEDEDRLWFLSDEGLIALDGGVWKDFRCFRPYVTFFDMVRLEKNRFWLGCNTGIALFDGEEYHFFNTNDGVAVEECNLGAALRDSQGRIWLGGTNITLVDPTEIREFPSVEPLITEAVYGEATQVQPKSARFSSRVGSLLIRFSAPSYFNEQDQIFRYRMAGLDERWSAPTGEHSVRYLRIPPGNYRFELQSRQKFGGWGESVRTLPITVDPTFWQSAPGRILIVVALLVLGIAIGMIRAHSLKAQKIRLQGKVEEQTAEIRRQRDRLAELATLDDLTGLPNRRKFNEVFAAEAARCRRYRRAISLCVFDIDRFKDVNDRHGHPTGDEVLKRLAVRALSVIREIDTFARWGGDEFILLMPETEPQDALRICRRVLDSIRNFPVLGEEGDPVPITLSGGVAGWESGAPPEIKLDDIIKNADAALYRSKQDGRDCISLFVAEMDS